RLKPGDYARTVSKIQAIWKTFMPDNPFEYSFLDQQYDTLYKTDQTIGKVFSVFTFLSITVACLGLLGLAIYSAAPARSGSERCWALRRKTWLPCYQKTF